MPVALEVTYTTDLKLEASGDAEISLQAGWKRNFSFAAGALYVPTNTPKISWSKSSDDSGNLWQPIVLSAAGTLHSRVALVPQLDFKLY